MTGENTTPEAPIPPPAGPAGELPGPAAGPMESTGGEQALEAAAGGGIPAGAAAIKAERNWPRRVILALILALAAGMRLYHLDKNPPGLLADEASMGVNAIALLHTGKDLPGQKWPLYSRLDDVFGLPGIFANPVFQYSHIPVLAVTGLSAFGIRLTAVIYGLLGVLGAYLLGKAIAGPRLGLWGAFFLAISSWHILFSRVAFEAISMPFFVSLGAAFLVKGYKRGVWFVPAAAALAVAMYCYSTAKVFVPLLLIGGLVLGLRAVLRQWAWAIVAVLVLVVLSVPNIKSQMAGGAAETRTKANLIFTANLNDEAGYRYLVASPQKPLHKWVLERPKTVPWFVMGYNYLRYISPEYLFKWGDKFPRHCVPGMGMCHAFYLPLVILGLEFLLWNWRNLGCRLILWWMLVYPVAPSMATGSPHGIRSLHAMPAIDIIAAMGVFSLLSTITSWKPKALFLNRKGRIAILVLAGITYWGAPRFKQYLHAYYVAYEQQQGCFWQSGMREAFGEIAKMRPEIDRAYVTGGVLNNYLYAMIFGGVDPSKVDFTKPYDEQLVPYKFHLSQSPPARLMSEKDLILCGNWEYDRSYSGFEIVKTFACMPNGPALYILARGKARPMLALTDGFDSLTSAPEKFEGYAGFDPPALLALTRLGRSKAGEIVRWRSAAPEPGQNGFSFAVSFSGTMTCRLSMNGTAVADFSPTPGESSWTGQGWSVEFVFLNATLGNHGVMIVRPAEGTAMPDQPVEWTLEILDGPTEDVWFGVRSVRRTGDLVQ